METHLWSPLRHCPRHLSPSSLLKKSSIGTVASCTATTEGKLLVLVLLARRRSSSATPCRLFDPVYVILRYCSGHGLYDWLLPWANCTDDKSRQPSSQQPDNSREKRAAKGE